jgi:hypothetical protein
MKTSFYFQFCSLVVVVAMTAGCGSAGLGPVSGKVTLDGKPLADVEVLFAPQAVEGNSNPGVYSYCKTDSEGNYELKTKNGKRGAVIGKHSVTIQYPDEGDIEETRDELLDAMEDAQDPDGGGSAEEVASIKARLDKLRERQKRRPTIPAFANVLEVPKGGIRPCNFELVSD